MSLAIGSVNHVDSGTLVASSGLSTLPVSLLQNAHVGRKWRSSSNSVYLTIDFGATIDFRVVAFFGINLTDSGSYRIRASLVDNTAISGEVYDSTAITTGLSDNDDVVSDIQSSTLSARYMRIDLEDSSLSYIQAGRLVVTDLFVPQVNDSYGREVGRTDLSKVSKSRGGQTYVDRGETFRWVKVSLDWLSETEARDTIADIEKLVGLHQDILLLLDTESSDPGRDTFWGLITDEKSVTHPLFGVYSKSFTMEERL